MSLGERLRWAREAGGLTTKGLDRMASLGEGHTAMVETGRRKRPSDETLRAFANVLGLRPEWLLLGSGSAPDPREIRRAVYQAALKIATRRPSADRPAKRNLNYQIGAEPKR